MSSVNINVLYEDNHLLVVEKPVNILSQGDNTNDTDMVNLLKAYLKEKYNKPGNVYLGLVHRLDRPVGGAMVFAQGDNTNDTDMVNLLKAYLKEKYNKPGNVYLGLVHRLDRPVGGAMVFAKTSKAAARLSEQVRNKTFKKTYRAVINGKMRKQSDTLKDYLYKNKKTNMVSVVSESHKDSKYAELSYETLAIERLSMER